MMKKSEKKLLDEVKQNIYFVIKKNRVTLLFICMLMLTQNIIYGQVTIGLGAKPNEGALLDLKNIDGITDGSTNATKGLLLPRVELSDKYQLYPMFLNDPTNPTSGPNSDYLTNKATIDKTHTGLTVYNMVEDYVKDLCLGMNFWDGEQWMCMMSPKLAKYTMECSNVVVEGLYYKDKELSQIPNEVNGEVNRIKVTLTNIPSSSFGSVAVLETNAIDGISFKGVAQLTQATQVVYLEGTGTPTNFDDKTLTISTNSTIPPSIPCTATVVIVIPPQRLMTLGNTDAAYGYNFGLPTSRTNATIGYTSGNDLITSAENFGSYPWSIVKFAGFKNVSSALNSNTPATAATINTWIDDNRDIVCLEQTRWTNMTAATLESFLKGTNGKRKVDVFMIGYNVDFYRDGNTSDAQKCQVVVDYVKAGGILMICSEQTISNANFMRLFFNKADIGSALGAGAGAIYTLGFNSSNTPETMRPYYCTDDDPIIAGPFENLVGQTWGEDASTTRYITNLPLDEVIIYSGARPVGNGTHPAEAVTIFRAKDYPFVFVGDGGFNSNEVRTYTGLTVCPFRLTNKVIDGHTYRFYPTSRTYGNASSKASNAIFTANAFAWCIKKADEVKNATK